MIELIIEIDNDRMYLMVSPDAGDETARVRVTMPRKVWSGELETASFVVPVNQRIHIAWVGATIPVNVTPVVQPVQIRPISDSSNVNANRKIILEETNEPQRPQTRPDGRDRKPR